MIKEGKEKIKGRGEQVENRKKKWKRNEGKNKGKK